MGLNSPVTNTNIEYYGFPWNTDLQLMYSSVIHILLGAIYLCNVIWLAQW